MKAENCNQAISKLVQAVDANNKAIGVNRKAVAEMVNLLWAKVIKWGEARSFLDFQRKFWGVWDIDLLLVDCS